MLPAFHPAVSSWFGERLGEPTPPQREGWPLDPRGRDTSDRGADRLGQDAGRLPVRDRRPAPAGRRAARRDAGPLRLAAARARRTTSRRTCRGRSRRSARSTRALPEVRVLVRTGDTPAGERAAMTQAAAAHPGHDARVALPAAHVARAAGAMLRDGAHGDRRRDPRAGARQARLPPGALARAARGADRTAAAAHRPLRDAEAARGGRRASWSAPAATCAPRRRRAPSATLDLAVEVPPSPLATVCSHEQWEEIYARMAELVREHRTTLVFVNTRKMAERIAAQLTKLLGEDAVTSHHGSLSRERRLDAEQRLKAGTLRALVATASLELGIDIGDVDLVVQVGATRSIATLLQRVGRAGHALGACPRAASSRSRSTSWSRRRRSCAACAAALLDRTATAAAAARHPGAAGRGRVRRRAPWDEDGALRDAPPRLAVPRPRRARSSTRWWRSTRERPPRAAPPRRRERPRCCATRRARLTALTSGGAIPDTADYQVRLEPEGTSSARSTRTGRSSRTAATSSSSATRPGASCASSRASCASPTPRARRRPCRSGSARRRAARASCRRRSPTCARVRRRRERRGRRRQALAAAVAALRDACGEALPSPPRPARRVRAGRPRSARRVPTQRRVVLERFFDESGRHAARGARALRLAHQPRLGPRAAQALLRRLRLRAAGGGQRGGDRAVASARSTASRSRRSSTTCTRRARATCSCRRCSRAPMFATRWRWNAQRSLLLERTRNGKRVPAALLRMRADDLLVAGVSRRRSPAPRRCPAGRSRCPTSTRSCARRSRTACTEAMDVGRLPRGAARAARRLDRAARGRHARALGLRARHPRQRSPTPSSTTRRSRSAARRP